MKFFTALGFEQIAGPVTSSDGYEVPASFIAETLVVTELPHKREKGADVS